jgi:ergothioneine biosynthesis protein EgtB
MEESKVIEEIKLWQSYRAVREHTEDLARPLETEDYVVQSMPDVSPAKWHLAHTTWFFETFLLQKFLQDYKPFHNLYGYLFNSYYETIGDRWSRTNRGLLSRPTVRDVYEYRSYVDEQIQLLMEKQLVEENQSANFLIELGIHHEQQHQELLITDIKHVLALNPLHPVYAQQSCDCLADAIESRFVEFSAGLHEIGFSGPGFSFDNERPGHRVYVEDFSLQNRLVTNAEYLQFIQDGGYSNFRHWLSDGWAMVQQQQWRHPLYWENKDGAWYQMTLTGFHPLNLSEPVCHVSYYEADAYAKWANKRLPTEAEWEIAASTVEKKLADCNFLESGNFHPQPNYELDQPLIQMFGDVWEWTQSAYLPYPGFRQEPGAVGEYNGKFMSNQMVLRGGSCATPLSHIRKTYRNFFQCDKRWQFMGIRLASEETTRGV